MILFYIPCPDKQTATSIACVLLQEKLVACANIIPGMESMYWWQGKIETSSEHILLLKTLPTSDTQNLITKRILELHPYDTPCVMKLSDIEINSSFQKWLEDSLK